MRKLGTHDDYKIIVDGKELSFPILRMFVSWALMFVLGYMIATL